ncbi:A disintegrin and metalloproteinase with thrombospondin motifs 7-like [Penaeus indicus]|uniref:A disintegrin and metalloproteinase with thrombospondin motifs 7-like n=1 Tax=Penaeus indicus TaxID=29960 RepID=UPI00300D2845
MATGQGCRESHACGRSQSMQTGYLRTDKGEYLIEPVRNHARNAHDPHPHVVYKRSALPTQDHERHSCATKESYERALHEREEWEESQEDEMKKRRRRRRRRRSVSVERNVEVTVVADKKMVDYYSNEDINTYILTVMNMVSSVYRDASLGNAVNMYVVRIMLLEDPQYEEELDISHNADDTLRSFCQWQQMINPGNETHPYHHDVAVLITRYNICSRMTERCSTLGVAEIAGMCQPLRSCNVNEDTGLQIAYTIAHELGHNFGMNHDGPQNGCQAQYGVSQHVMSPHLTSEPLPVTWSNCSRKEITHFLDRDWGACLEDEPPQVEYSFPELPPGAMYDADHQCRLSFGAGATHCEGIEGTERICQTLWCHLDNRCITRMEPAAEGTHCGKHKWCVMGRCVTMGERPAAINGEWGSWSSWSQCTRSCGAGTQMAERHCDNPAPANGGRYCTGDRKRYRICNTEDCPENGVSFRAQQCSKFNAVPYKGANHTWQPVMQHHTPCELQCKPDDEFYSVKLAEVVADGTPCKLGTRDMCINGMCKDYTNKNCQSIRTRKRSEPQHIPVKFNKCWRFKSTSARDSSQWVREIEVNKRWRFKSTSARDSSQWVREIEVNKRWRFKSTSAGDSSQQCAGDSKSMSDGHSSHKCWRFKSTSAGDSSRW